MPSKTDEDIVAVWSAKVDSAEKYYADWERLFKVPELEQYEEGFQWADEINGYVMNMFYSTIEVKSPSLTFGHPIVNIKPKPQELSEDPEMAYQFARNNENAINTWLLDEKNNFKNELLSAIDDAWSRFGIIEVGYSADWIDNPKVRKPRIRSDYRPGVDRHARTLYKVPEQIPINEQVFARAIPAERFRVSVPDAYELTGCEWCGYFEYHRIEDIINNTRYKNRSEVRSGGINLRYQSKRQREDLERLQKSPEDIVKIWKIWDIRAQQRYVFSGTDVSVNTLLHKIHYKRFPFMDLRFKRRKKARGFYPLPFTFNWVGPQNEINEVRETHRNHRRRFKRLYTYNKSAFEEPQEEIEQFLNGPDGSVLGASRDNPIFPVPNSDLGASANISLQTSFDDFNRVSGTAAEQRGETDKTTATQAAIANNRARLRETKEQEKVAELIKGSSKLVLLTTRDMVVNPFAVNNFEPEPFYTDINVNGNGSVIIDPLIDLGEEDFDFSITFQIGSLSPVASEEDLQKFIQFLALLSQFPQFSMSPTLVRELAAKSGYNNERVIREFQQMAQLAMLAQLQQAGMMGKQQQPGNLGQQTVQQMTPPTGEKVRNQLQGQGIPIG